jgi:WS/DGAT/MGAT family acyltransferase
MMQKMHHCLMDGEGAAKLGQVMNDLEPDAPPRPVDPAISGARAGRVPGPWAQSINLARHYYTLPFRAAREAYGAVLPRIRSRIGGGGAATHKPAIPLAYFNADISPHRDFVFGSLSLDDIKTVKNHFDATVNDVIMALVSGSLRAYLQARGELPAESLRTSMPVSLRTDGDEEFGNRLTATTVTLATDLEDPVARLRAISGDSTLAKQAAHAGGKGFMEVMQLLPPFMVNAMMNLAPPEATVSALGTNLLVSSVRGSPWPMYRAGVKQTATYPISIITPGSGINVTCVSYAGHVDFGITLEPSMFPEPWDLIDGLHGALKEYLALTMNGSSRGKRATVKSGTPGRKRTAARKRP